jgi:mannose-1-phosphate guanylyltransferase/mannose-6-phosphate isomerase
LQKYQCLVEYYLVVKGAAEVINRDEIFSLSENQSIYTPLHKIYGLTNPGLAPLEVIEVLSGKYLGENDIIRLDQY